MKASELLVRCLENEGVELVFGLPGEGVADGPWPAGSGTAAPLRIRGSLF